MLRASREHLRAETKLIWVKYICTSSIADLAVNCAGFILLSILLFPMVDHGTLLFWIMLNGAATLYRSGVIVSFKKLTATARDNAGAYLVHLVIGVLLSGLFFGSAGFFLYPKESVMHQILLTLILWVTATLSVDTSVLFLGTAVARPLLMGGPVTLVSLLGASNHQLFLGLLGVVCLVVQLFYSLRLHRYLSENCSLQLDNMELTSELIHEVNNRIAVEHLIKTSGDGRGA